MTEKNLKNKALPGIILVAVGAILLLKNLGIFLFEIPGFIFGWQGILILIAIILWQNPKHHKTAMVLGFIALVGIIPRFWPLVIIAAGIYIILTNEKNGSMHSFFNWSGRREDADPEADEHKINDISIFGGGEKYFNSKRFSGGRIIAVFGGSDFDLIDCKLAEGESTLEVFAIFGGFSIHLPSDWNVRVDVLPIFGGISDKRRQSNASGELLEDGIKRRLLVRGIVLFGGGDIKN